MGLSSFDLLGDMPAPQRVLMRLFLRQVRMSATDLNAAVANLPPEKQMTPEQQQEALAALMGRGWLKQMEENGQVVYSVQQVR